METLVCKLYEISLDNGFGVKHCRACGTQPQSNTLVSSYYMLILSPLLIFSLSVLISLSLNLSLYLTLRPLPYNFGEST